MKQFVLDAHALLDFLENGPAAEKVGRLLKDAAAHQQPLLVSVVNWGEVFYLSWQRVGEDRARQALAKLSRFSISIVPVDLSQSLKAGEIKALHHIPYVDCLAAALAMLNQSTLVTADRDFEKLGRNFPVLWLPRR
jgi:predicted nucleic acid-binding protein